MTHTEAQEASTSHSTQHLNRIANESSIGTVGSYLGILINYGLVWILTRTLAPEEYGIFSLGQSILNFSLVFVLFGTPKALDRFIPQYRALGEIGKIRSLVERVLKWVSLTSVMAMIVLFILSPWLAARFSEPQLGPAMRVLLIAIPAIALEREISSVFLGVKKLRYRIYIERILVPALKCLMALLILWLRLGLEEWLWAFSAASLGGTAVALWFCYQKVWSEFRISPAQPFDFSAIIVYAWPLSVSSVLSLIVGQMDILLLGYYRSSAEVGIFRVYVYLGALMGVAKMSFAQIFKPVASEMIAQRDLEGVLGIYGRVAKWLFLLNLGILVLFMVLGKEVMGLLFREEYLAGFSALVVILASRFFNSALGPEGMVLEALGHTKYSLLNMLIMLICNFLLDVLLIPRYGIIGAAVGMGLATVFGGLAGLVEIYLLYRFQPFRWKHLVYLGSGALSATVIHWAGLTDITGGIIASVLVFVLVYLGCIVISGGLDDVDCQLMRQTFQRLIGYKYFKGR